MRDWREIAEVKAGRTRLRNAGWAYDAYPDLPMLDAGAELLIAEIEGPAVITTVHVNQHRLLTGDHDLDTARALASRGLVFEITYDDAARASVRVPLADFFADGCGGLAAPFSTAFVEKTPQSYNCYIPMPFEHGARVVLHNQTPYDLANYTYIEYEELSDWEPELGYFHATWARRAFQLDGDTCVGLFTVDGRGHLIGHAWSVTSDDPFFSGMKFAMEGNVGFGVDGADHSAIDYLGSECLFGQCWGFEAPFAGVSSGINHVQRSDPVMVSAYRFRTANVLRFSNRLDVRIDWTNEFRSQKFHRMMDTLPDAVLEAVFPGKQFLPAPRSEGRGWIDYATSWYWYQDRSTPVGYDHEPLPPLDERIRTVLHPNPKP